jgi:hypothetical protein
MDNNSTKSNNESGLPENVQQAIGVRNRAISHILVDNGINLPSTRLNSKELTNLQLWKLPAEEETTLQQVRKILLDATGTPRNLQFKVVEKLNNLGFWHNSLDLYQDKAISEMRKYLVDPKLREQAVMQHLQGKIGDQLKSVSSYQILKNYISDKYTDLYQNIQHTLLNETLKVSRSADLYDYLMTQISETKLPEEDKNLEEILSIIDSYVSSKELKFISFVDYFLEKDEADKVKKTRRSFGSLLSLELNQDQISSIKEKYETKETGKLYTSIEFAELIGKNDFARKNYESIVGKLNARIAEYSVPESFLGIKKNQELEKLLIENPELQLIVELNQEKFILNTTFLVSEHLKKIYSAITNESDEVRMEDGYATFRSILESTIAMLSEEEQNLFDNDTITHIRNGIVESYKLNFKNSLFGIVQVGMNSEVAYGVQDTIQKITSEYVEAKLEINRLEQDDSYFTKKQLNKITINDFNLTLSNFQIWLYKKEIETTRPAGSIYTFYKISDLAEYLNSGRRSLNISEEKLKQILFSINTNSPEEM